MLIKVANVIAGQIYEYLNIRDAANNASVSHNSYKYWVQFAQPLLIEFKRQLRNIIVKFKPCKYGPMPDLPPYHIISSVLQQHTCGRVPFVTNYHKLDDQLTKLVRIFMDMYNITITNKYKWAFDKINILRFSEYMNILINTKFEFVDSAVNKICEIIDRYDFTEDQIAISKPFVYKLIKLQSVCRSTLPRLSKLCTFYNIKIEFITSTQIASYIIELTTDTISYLVNIGMILPQPSYDLLTNREYLFQHFRNLRSIEKKRVTFP